jgi:translation initiation factor 4A
MNIENFNTTDDTTDDTSKNNTPLESIDSFDDMGLKESILRGIYTYGFEKPSSIQQKAILPIVQGKDIIAQAQSGTGKTATFVIGSLVKIDEKNPSLQVLILAPTRELAIQIKSVVESLSEYMSVTNHLLIGGKSVRDDIDILKKGIQISIGTPGRVFDMIKRNALNIDNLKMFVLDEADEMLSRGFQEQIYDIIQFIPKNTQIGIFSATMSENTYNLSKNFMNNPLEILVKNDELTLEGIRQFYVNIDNDFQKFDVLVDIYKNLTVSQTIIYSNTKKGLLWLNDKLNEINFSCGMIHSDLTQEERNSILNEFRAGKIRILIATDIVARGIDIQQVSIIINYDFPKNYNTYIHRIGRSGRYGRIGTALNIVDPNELKNMKECEQIYNTKIEYLPSDLNSVFK